MALVRARASRSTPCRPARKGPARRHRCCRRRRQAPSTWRHGPHVDSCAAWGPQPHASRPCRFRAPRPRRTRPQAPSPKRGSSRPATSAEDTGSPWRCPTARAIRRHARRCRRARKGCRNEKTRHNGASRQRSIVLKKMARPKGFEPLTPRFVVWCSIQLSYGRLPTFDAGEQHSGAPCRPSGRRRGDCYSLVPPNASGDFHDPVGKISTA